MSQVSVSSKGSDVDERFADLSLEVSTKAHTVASPTSAAVEKRNSPIAAGIGTRSTPNLKVRRCVARTCCEVRNDESVISVSCMFELC